jgi:hypothetical protein
VKDCVFISLYVSIRTYNRTCLLLSNIIHTPLFFIWHPLLHPNIVQSYLTDDGIVERETQLLANEGGEQLHGDGARAGTANAAVWMCAGWTSVVAKLGVSQQYRQRGLQRRGR